MGAVANQLRFAVGVARGRPFSALVQVTNRCNMRCSFCDFWSNGVAPAEELTLDDYRRVAGELGELGCFLVSIEGGEPTVRPDLVEIVRAFAARHLTVLYTNGWHVTDELARALFAAGLTQVGVSIDFADADRHDAKRGLTGTTERAWRAVDLLRAAAPHGGRQVHVMTVLMEENWRELEALLEQSAAREVGHVVTLLADGGYRRGPGPDRPPPPEAAAALEELWRRHDHLRVFRGYFPLMGTFLAQRTDELPACRAGLQSFNLDHVGNVAPCIEKIDQPVGNVRDASLAQLHARLAGPEVAGAVAGCQQCWTACRAWAQLMGQGGSLPAWRDLATRMRSS